MKRLIMSSLLSSALFGCTADCFSWKDTSTLGSLTTELDEVSGLVASRAQPGVLYAHNDSGDSARFFAVRTTGQTLTEFLVDGATNVDWEDVTLGPCPAGTCLYFGDMGNNEGTRSDLALYRVTEPTGLLGDSVATKKSIAAEKIPFVYPTGTNADAEALLMSPAGRLYLITKEAQGERSRLYRFPSTLTAGVTAQLEEVGKLTVPADGQTPVTAADVSPSGHALAVRMGATTVEYRVTSDFEDFRKGTPTVVPTVAEPQGEAVAYLADGLTLVTSTELSGSAPPLHATSCE